MNKEDVEILTEAIEILESQKNSQIEVLKTKDAMKFFYLFFCAPFFLTLFVLFYFEMLDYSGHSLFGTILFSIFVAVCFSFIVSCFATMVQDILSEDNSGSEFKRKPEILEIEKQISVIQSCLN